MEIFKPHWKYLGFAWGKGGSETFYVFTVLPFGLATACYVFTKLLQPLLKYWRAQGFRAVLYLDDGIVASNGYTAALKASHMVKRDLQRLGLVSHMENQFGTQPRH